MADVVFNNIRARLREYLVTDGADLIVVLLQAAEADDTLRDYDNLDDLLAAAGNTEADFTNYTRKVIGNGDITVTVDDTNNRLDVGFPDQTWAAAGGANDNTLVKILVCVDGANDAARIPVSAHDFARATDGGDLTIRPPVGGFYRSQ